MTGPVDDRIPVEVVHDAFLGWVAVSMHDSTVYGPGHPGQAEAIEYVQETDTLVLFTEPQE